MTNFVRQAGACCSFAVLLTTAACESRSSATSPFRPSAGIPALNPRIVVLGDSLATYPSSDQSFPAVLQRRISAISSDGIDPNAAGAERIAETVWPYLEPILWDR